MNLTTYIETFLCWPLAGRSAFVFFFVVFVLGLLAGKYILRLLSLIPFLLDKLFRGLYILIELPIDFLHRKQGGAFYDVEIVTVNIAEKVDSALIRWHTSWLRAKTPILLVFLVYLGVVLFTGVIPSLAGSASAPIAKGGELYLRLESRLIEQAKNQDWYTDPKEIVQDSLFMKIDNTHFLLKGQVKSIASPPVLQEGRPYLPVRDIVTALGGTVSWDNERQQAVIDLGQNTIRMATGSSEAFINDEEIFLADGQLPISIDTKMYIDLQAFSDMLGFHCYWFPKDGFLAVSSNIDHSFGPLTLQAVEEKLSPYYKSETALPTL